MTTRYYARNLPTDPWTEISFDDYATLLFALDARPLAFTGMHLAEQYEGDPPPA